MVSSGRHRRAPEERSSYREVFAVGEFRALWSAQVLSYTGDQFAQVAIAILVYGRTHSAFLTALAYALTYLPPIAGVADVANAMAAITAAVAEGAITPGEGAEVAKVVDAYVRALEASDFDRRLTALEAAHAADI